MDYELEGPLLLITGVVILAILVVMIFYLLTLQNTLKLVSPANRRMEPGHVWLMLIPVFNIIWQFFVVIRIADSLENEFRERNIPVEESRPGYSIGLAYCILNICGFIPFLGGLASLAALICWIVYWVKIAGYKNKLEQNNTGRGNILDSHI